MAAAVRHRHKELETNTDTDTEFERLPVSTVRIFLSPLSFFFSSFLYIFLFYILFCTTWTFLLLFLSLLFCLACATSVNFYAVWQCLNDIHIRSVCQLVRPLLIRPGYCTCFPESLELNHQSNELIQIQIQWSLRYIVQWYHFLYSVISSQFPLCLILLWLFPFSICCYLHSTLCLAYSCEKPCKTFPCYVFHAASVEVYVYVFLIFRKPQSRYENGHRLRHFEVVVHRPHRT